MRLRELGYRDMFLDMFNAIDEGREPLETFYDGYVVNAIIDACYKSLRNLNSGKRLNFRSGEARPKPPTRKRVSRILMSDMPLSESERMPDGRR